MGWGLENQKLTSLGGLEPPTFRLTAERANRLRHRDLDERATLHVFVENRQNPEFISVFGVRVAFNRYLV